MTELENTLIILVEECLETAQRATKALRFGINEIQPGQKLNNAQRIVYEFNDLYAMMSELKDKGFFEQIIDVEMVLKKKEKVKHFTDYSIQQGTVEKENKLS